MELVKPTDERFAMEPSQAREVLLAQHDKLRHVFTDTLRVANQVLAGEPAMDELRDRITLLRQLFAEHNESEEQLLRPILAQDYAWGQARIDRMMEEHVAEHAEIRAALTGSDREVAARIADLIEIVDAHMAAEERTFLSRSVLRDDSVSIDDGD